MTTRIKGFQKGHKHSEETKRKIGDALSRKVSYHCLYCGELAYTQPSFFAKCEKHFCSMGCYSEYRRNVMIKEEQNRYGTGMPQQERTLRAWCRSTSSHAIRSGILKHQPCRICNERGEMHHKDYNKPLSVEWLCVKCHRAWHKENPNLKKARDDR